MDQAFERKIFFQNNNKNKQSKFSLVHKYGATLQSIWVSGRGVQKEQDEAKLRFAAAEVI